MERPHDKWIIGESVPTGRTYVIHTERPRFIGEVFDDNDPHGIQGLSYAMPNGQSLANLAFLDEAPIGDALLKLLADASDAMGRYDSELGIS